MTDHGDNFDLVYDSDGWRGDVPEWIIAAILMGFLNE
jgi:hypothetical protein